MSAERENQPKLLLCWRFTGPGRRAVTPAHSLSCCWLNPHPPPRLFLLHGDTHSVELWHPNQCPFTTTSKPQDTHINTHTHTQPWPACPLSSPSFRQPVWQPVTSATGSAAVHHYRLALSRAPCCHQSLFSLPDARPGPNKARPGSAWRRDWSQSRSVDTVSARDTCWLRQCAVL